MKKATQIAWAGVIIAPALACVVFVSSATQQTAQGELRSSHLAAEYYDYQDGRGEAPTIVAYIDTRVMHDAKCEVRLFRVGGASTPDELLGGGQTERKGEQAFCHLRVRVLRAWGPATLRAEFMTYDETNRRTFFAQRLLDVEQR